MVATFVLVLAVGLVGVQGCKSSAANSSGSTSGTPSGSATVVAKNFTFSPANVAITVGGSVTWTNEDATTHNVEGDGGISSGDLAPGQSYTKNFATAGTYTYHCIIHPTMTGTVVVK